MSLNFNDISPYPFFVVTNSAQQIISASGITVIFDSSATGSSDPGNNYSADTFIAPVKGLYHFSLTLCCGGAGASAKASNAMRFGFVNSTTSTNRHFFVWDDFSRFSNTTSYYSRHISGTFFMNQGDTMSPVTSGISASFPVVFNPGLSWFSGHLITAIA